MYLKAFISRGQIDRKINKIWGEVEQKFIFSIDNFFLNFNDKNAYDSLVSIILHTMIAFFSLNDKN